MVNTSNVIRQAEAQGIPILVLTRADAPTLTNWLAASDAAMARIRAALGAGRLVFVPARPVTLGTTATTSWYEIDTASGETIRVGESGGHNAALEYRVLRATVFGFLSGVVTWAFTSFIPDLKFKISLALSRSMSSLIRS